MSLSYRALGLITHLRETHQPGEPIATGALARPEHREGRDAVRAMLRELAAAGHVRVDRAQDARGHWSTITTLVPQGGNTEVAPGTASPASVNLNPQVTPETGNPASAQPEPENPFPVQNTFPQVTPETAQPTPVKPGPSTSTPVGSRSSFSSVVTTKTKSAQRSSRDAGAHTRDLLADLNANASRPDAAAIVTAWANTLTIPLRPQAQRALTKATSDLLTDLGDRAHLPTLQAALDRWSRDGRTPAFLPHAYDDAARTARAASSPDVRTSGAHRPARPSTTDQRVADIQALKHQLGDEPVAYLRALPGA